MRSNYQNQFLISLSYDGSNYHGWVKQPHQELTIQAVLEKAIAIVIKTDDFYLLGASKTDTGVSAVDQKVSFQTNFQIKNLGAFRDGLNKALPNDIHLTNIELVDQNFNVRQVKQKEYEYTLNDGPYDVFQQRFVNQFPQKIDEVQLQTILNLFVGEHDFFLFSGLSITEATKFQTVRVIDEIKVSRQDNLVKVVFKAPGFLRYQIRMIMGASLVCLTNSQKLSLEQIQEKLNRQGNKAPFLASPNGLILTKVIY